MDELPRDGFERAVKTLSSALVIGGASIALAIYARPAPPRYEVITRGADILRIDTKTGTVIGCNTAGCSIVLKRGQRLDSSKSHGFLRDQRPTASPQAIEATRPQARIPAAKSNP